MLAGAVGCQSTRRAADDRITVAPTPHAETGRVIGRTPLALSGITWADGRLVVEVQRALVTRLGFFDLSSRRMELLPAISDSDCYRFEAVSPVALDGDRTAVVLRCSSKSAGGWRNSLAVIDASGRVRRLPDSRMIINGNPIASAGIMTMDARGAVIDSGDDACGSLFTWDATGIGPIDLRIGTTHPWSLATYFQPGYGGPQCVQLGVAIWPTLSPDGSRVAFAAKEIAGVDGLIARLYAPSQILIADRAWTRTTVIATGIEELKNLTWSPSGGWIAFTGRRDGVQGIWLVPENGGAVLLLSETNARSIAWAPDGASIVAVERANAFEGPSTIVRFDDLLEIP
jgi:hypothetical protein